MLIRLDSEVLYYYVRKGEGLLPDIKWAMPFGANEWRNKEIPSIGGHAYSHFFNGFIFVNDIRDGVISFDRFFNYNKSEAININVLATLLEKTITEGYKNKSAVIDNKKLVNRAILGAQIPDQEVSVTEVKYRLEFDWGNLKSEEYLRSFSRPFATLGGQMQLILSNIEGETLQQKEQNIIRAEYIGTWVDVTSDVVAAFTPLGLAIGLAQTAAGIGADVLEHNPPDTDHNSVYVLTKTGESNELVANHCGLAVFRYYINNSDLHLDFLMAHPYVVINKYPAVADFLTNDGFVSKEQLHKYNIKNVARFLGTKAICSELESYDAMPGEHVKTFSFNGVNPITQSIGYQLDSFSKLFSKKSAHNILDEPDYSDELESPATTSSVIHDYYQSLEILKSHVKDSFASVKPVETISPEVAEATIQKIMRDYDAEILSEKITDGLEHPDEEVKAFSGEVITSVNHAYEKVSKVKALFDEAEISPEIKADLKGLLDEATGLNDDVLVNIDKKDISAISDIFYDRFKNNIDKIHCFLSEQKTSNYNVFVLYRYRQPDLSNVQAIALPYDSKKRIMVAMLPQDKRRGGLVDTVVHEVLHNATTALEHTYIGDLRAKRGSFPSSFEFSARKTEHFIENNQSKIDNIRYALDLPRSIMPTERQQQIARAVLHNSKLIKADTLLNAAEYNAYMIHVLSGARVEGLNIKLEDELLRSKRSVDESDSLLDHIVMVALLSVSIPRHHIEFNQTIFNLALDFFLKQDMETPPDVNFLPYL